MVTLWVVTALAVAGDTDCAALEGEAKTQCELRDCAKLEGEAKTRCDQRETSRSELQAELTELGTCETGTEAEQAACNEKRSNLTERIAALDAAPRTVAAGKGAKARRSNTNRLEMDIDDE